MDFRGTVSRNEHTTSHFGKRLWLSRDRFYGQAKLAPLCGGMAVNNRTLHNIIVINNVITSEKFILRNSVGPPRSRTDALASFLNMFEAKPRLVLII
jgi:hypothetical protein